MLRKICMVYIHGLTLIWFRHIGPGPLDIFWVKVVIPNKKQPGIIQQAGLYIHQLMNQKTHQFSEAPRKGYGRIVRFISHCGLFSVNFRFSISTLNFGIVLWNLRSDKIEKHLLNTYWVQYIMQITKISKLPAYGEIKSKIYSKVC